MRRVRGMVQWVMQDKKPSVEGVGDQRGFECRGGDSCLGSEVYIDDALVGSQVDEKTGMTWVFHRKVASSCLLGWDRVGEVVWRRQQRQRRRRSVIPPP